MEEEKVKERSKEEREGEDDQEGIGIIKRKKRSLIKEDIGRRKSSLERRREVFFEDQDHQGFLDSCSV